MKTNYPISQICEDVAYQLTGHADDIPMIRQAINDHVDALSKDGHKVNFRFDQDAAVFRVLRIMREREPFNPGKITSGRK